MNKRINYAIFAMFLSFTLLFLGCEKKDKLEKSENNTITKRADNATRISSSVKVVNGRLVFMNAESFKEYVDELIELQGNPETIHEINRELCFKSMNEFYNEGMNLYETDDFEAYILKHKNVFYVNELDDMVQYELQSPYVLSFIANEDGVYQVGNSIYRTSFKYYYEITDGDESKIPMIVEGSSIKNDNSIVINDARPDDAKGQYSYRTTYFNSKHRIVARLYHYTGGGLNWYDARVTAQKKNFIGIWFRESIDYVKLEWGRGHYIVDGYPNNINVMSPYSGTSSKNKQVTLANTIAPIDFDHSVCNVTSSGKRSGTIKTLTRDAFD